MQLSTVSASSRSSRSASSSSPPRARTRARARATASTGDACDGSAIYLLHERATGVAAVGNTSNQVKFMQLMGLVDDDDNISISQPPTDFPVEDEQLLLLQTAIDHTYYPQHRQRVRNEEEEKEWRQEMKLKQEIELKERAKEEEEWKKQTAVRNRKEQEQRTARKEEWERDRMARIKEDEEPLTCLHKTEMAIKEADRVLE